MPITQDLEVLKVEIPRRLKAWLDITARRRKYEEGRSHLGMAVILGELIEEAMEREKKDVGE